jgi:hypothetical protein
MNLVKLVAVLLTPVVVLVVSNASAQTPSKVPESDVQNWNDVLLAIPMSTKVDFVIHGTLRIGGNLTTPVDERMGVGFVFKVNKYLGVNPFYFHRDARPPNGKHEEEERLTLGATLQAPAGKFTFSDRNWIEPGDINIIGTQLRFRR